MAWLGFLHCQYRQFSLVSVQHRFGAHKCLFGSLAAAVGIVAALVTCSLEPDTWSFMVDSNEVQTQQRSQNSLIIKLDGASVMYQPNASSITFASERIGEAHADISSGSVKIYAVCMNNATLDIMGLSYVAEEMGMASTFPFTLEMENDAARIFCL